MLSRRRLLALTALFAVGCRGSESGSDDGESGASAKVISLNGAGATFPYPLYSKWVTEYNRLNPAVRINYQSIGSGGGIRQIVAGTVDFGASDAPIKGDEAKGAAGKLTHLPMTIGAVAVSYNLSGLSVPLRLSSQAVAGIFLGEIRNWDDPRLARDNPGVRLPAREIAVVVRTDGSGTTSVFSEYLASISQTFRDKVGVGKSVKWPIGLGAKGNEGVTGQLKTAPGAIGYIELAYATQNKLPSARIQNRAGRFVAPTVEASTAAAAGVELPSELHVSLAGSTNEAAYPIASYTYLLVYDDARDTNKGQALARFVWWAIHDGQKYAKDLDYAPLPAQVVSKVEGRLKELRAGGRRLLDGA
jgi:phosphate transport system substrate-binding protein